MDGFGCRPECECCPTSLTLSTLLSGDSLTENDLSKRPKFHEPSFSCYFTLVLPKEAIMLAISLTLASACVFGAHVWTLYQDTKPIVVRATKGRY